MKGELFRQALHQERKQLVSWKDQPILFGKNLSSRHDFFLYLSDVQADPKAGNYTDCCVVDGLIMFTLGHIATNLRWDEETFPQSYDLYDYDYCLSVMGHGYKVAVLDILLEHGSAGEGVNAESWKINRERFINKWTNIGLTFPIKVSKK